MPTLGVVARTHNRRTCPVLSSTGPMPAGGKVMLRSRQATQGPTGPSFAEYLRSRTGSTYGGRVEVLFGGE